jgi:hypothetical protein
MRHAGLRMPKASGKDRYAPPAQAHFDSGNRISA